MWALLRTRRWLSFTATALVAIIAFGFLSRWQWERAHEEDARASEVSHASSAAPVDLQTLPVDQPLPDDAEYRTATVTGQLQCDRGFLVRNKPLNGTTGFWVACPLRTDEGTWAWINRGWLAASGRATEVVAMPPAPEAQVSVAGHLRKSQDGPDTQPADLPSGQVVALDTQVLSSMAGLDGPAYEPYVEATAMSPADPAGLQPLPLPTKDSAQNYSYAGQWLLFAVIAIGGWFYFLRREAREDAQAQPVA